MQHDCTQVSPWELKRAGDKDETLSAAASAAGTAGEERARASFGFWTLSPSSPILYGPQRVGPVTSGLMRRCELLFGIGDGQEGIWANGPPFSPVVVALRRCIKAFCQPFENITDAHAREHLITGLNPVGMDRHDSGRIQ